MATYRNRDRKGKYSYTDMELDCKCGHKLGRHVAEYPHDCCYGDEATGEYNQDCPCAGFKKKKTT